jgi:hypothetical protein
VAKQIQKNALSRVLRTALNVPVKQSLKDYAEDAGYALRRISPRSFDSSKSGHARDANSFHHDFAHEANQARRSILSHMKESKNAKREGRRFSRLYHELAADANVPRYKAWDYVAEVARNKINQRGPSVGVKEKLKDVENELYRSLSLPRRAMREMPVESAILATAIGAGALGLANRKQKKDKPASSVGSGVKKRMSGSIEKKVSLRSVSESLKPLRHLLFGGAPKATNSFSDYDVRNMDLTSPIPQMNDIMHSQRTGRRAEVRRLNAQDARDKASLMMGIDSHSNGGKKTLTQQFYGAKHKYHDLEEKYWNKRKGVAQDREFAYMFGRDSAGTYPNKKLKIEIPYHALKTELDLRDFVENNPRKAIIGTVLAAELARRASQKKDKPASSVGSGVKKKAY